MKGTDAFPRSRWPLEPLGSLCQPNQSVNPRESPRTRIRYIDISSVCKSTFQVTGHADYLGADAPSRARKAVAAGDVIFATTRPYLRNVAQVPEKYDGAVCSTGFCVLRANQRALSDWLYYLCLSDGLMHQVTPKMRGANYPAVSDKDVFAAVVPAPPLDEQRRIVGRIREAMERVDELRRLREETTAHSNRLFEAGLSSLADSNWPVESLADLGVGTRNGWSGKKDPDGQPVRVLKLSAVHGMIIQPDKSKEVSLGDKVVSTFRLTKDDLFVVRGNGSKHLLGRPAIAMATYSDVIFNDLLIRLRPPKKLLPEFLLCVLVLPATRRDIEARAKTAAGIWKINQKQLAQVQVPTPPIPLQRGFVERARDLRTAANALVSDLGGKAVGNLPAAILRKAFAGEL